METSKLSRPSWLVSYQDNLPVHRQSPIQVLTGSGDTTRYRAATPLTFPQNALPKIVCKSFSAPYQQLIALRFEGRLFHRHFALCKVTYSLAKKYGGIPPLRLRVRMSNKKGPLDIMQ